VIVIGTVCVGQAAISSDNHGHDEYDGTKYKLFIKDTWA